MNNKFLLSICVIGVLAIMVSCKKTGIISDKNASVFTSADTLHFDTVFTTTGSVTQYVKIFNNNDQNIILSNVQLMGGANSYFSMNVDGSSGTTFSNIEIAPNDSVYIFVKVSVDSNNKQLPFIVQDSIRYTFNGNTRFIQLDAYGRNAIFLRNTYITQNTTFTDSLPIVILGGLYVMPNVTLTINPGTAIYSHADAPIEIYGTLRAMGDSNNRISFQCDRLDNPYNTYPGSWPGIFIYDQSDTSVMNFTNINNAYQGIVVTGTAPHAHTMLTLNECIINNISAEGILGTSASITAVSCLFSNCGTNVSITSGGNYFFNQCTIVSYDNSYVAHKIPVVSISNNDGTNPNSLTCIFNNSIVYGEGGLVNDEISVSQIAGPAFNVNFYNVFYKLKDNLNNGNVIFNNACIRNQIPAFMNIDLGNNIYDFHLQDTSACIAAGNSNFTSPYDINGRNWGSSYDIGCYSH